MTWAEADPQESMDVVISGLPDYADKEYIQDILQGEKLMGPEDEITELTSQEGTFIATFSNLESKQKQTVKYIENRRAPHDCVSSCKITLKQNYN